MPDDWKGHPFLKDYALTEELVQFKHGVNPKVPSDNHSYTTQGIHDSNAKLMK